MLPTAVAGGRSAWALPVVSASGGEVDEGGPSRFTPFELLLFTYDPAHFQLVEKWFGVRPLARHRGSTAW
ncbi:hypothetical protein WMF31_37525 [Sorangium sp. So ce1036]|uniref:hypothetical protein n=1 Tax=Sorangium sp. So ce1036 TaxID=3133328 RepID=UPI003F0515BB